jgi:hypothetical protein
MPKSNFLLHHYKKKNVLTSVEVQQLEHLCFCVTEHTAGPAAYLSNAHEVNLQQGTTQALNLLIKFLHPAYQYNPNTRECFTAYKYLVWEDGNANQVISEGCVCRDWIFFAYGCGHIFRLHMMKQAGYTFDSGPCLGH